MMTLMASATTQVELRADMSKLRVQLEEDQRRTSARLGAMSGEVATGSAERDELQQKAMHYLVNLKKLTGFGSKGVCRSISNENFETVNFTGSVHICSSTLSMSIR